MLRRKARPARLGVALLLPCVLLACFAGWAVFNRRRSVLLSYAPPYQDPYSPPDDDTESAMETLNNAKKDHAKGGGQWHVRKIDHGEHAYQIGLYKRYACFCWTGLVLFGGCRRA
jgi:hypothetical protein